MTVIPIPMVASNDTKNVEWDTNVYKGHGKGAHNYNVMNTLFSQTCLITRHYEGPTRITCL